MIYDESGICEDYDDQIPFGFLDLPQNQIDAELEQTHHIRPSRIFRLSFGMIEKTGRSSYSDSGTILSLPAIIVFMKYLVTF